MEIKAIFKDGAVRCSVCEDEIWEDVDCSCGIDGADHIGLSEAYEKKYCNDMEEIKWKQRQEIGQR